MLGVTLSTTLVDPLWYKNVFWWGLDMIADGNVLIFTAAVWYFLTPLLTGRKLYAENVVRTVILADLLVSLGVWGHHMMADAAQPTLLLIEGQIVTWGELITMGLTMFAVLMTIWKARPVKYVVPMAAVLLSMAGYAIGGSGGIIQANYALNRYIHNTMWVIGIHAHIQLLAGLSLTIFAVIYALAPILTGKGLNERLGYAQLFLWFTGAMVMGVDWGLAGVAGMLRRWLYLDNSFTGYMDVGLVGGVMLGTAFLLFLYNFLRTYGIGAIVAAFTQDRSATAMVTPTAAALEEDDVEKDRSGALAGRTGSTAADGP
jgi:cytochrome c oxidase subunit 1